MQLNHCGAAAGWGGQQPTSMVLNMAGLATSPCRLRPLERGLRIVCSLRGPVAPPGGRGRSAGERGRTSWGRGEATRRDNPRDALPALAGFCPSRPDFPVLLRFAWGRADFAQRLGRASRLLAAVGGGSDVLAAKCKRPGNGHRQRPHHRLQLNKRPADSHQHLEYPPVLSDPTNKTAPCECCRRSPAAV